MASTIAGAETGFEPIPGYVLRDKIGVGGYGEVWLADAPGGLKKAIKFVFGSVDEERAGSELKSLQRIRAVNHPFILSLERIEIVDSRLIVVTELADGSLLDRFREFNERGLVGIPRDKLMEYMRDSADALDFLCQRHDLQHLDVKPANLLLVADRIKVADFGLIKEVQGKSMSLMGGMTPTYAAPEMFDGRPGRYSDQYSLAIVYQEMLTGTLPFRGRTTAQLATEHLHKAPDLEKLPIEERNVIARALSKRPNQRFGSCREMIDALFRVGQSPRSSDASDGPVQKQRKTLLRSNTATPREAASKPQVNSSENKPTSYYASTANDSPTTERREVVWLPPLDLSQQSEFDLSPAFFVGFGGTGAEILTSLRSRLQSSGIDLKEQNDLGWLLVDTDEKTVQKATDAGTNGRLMYEHILLTPLKSSQQYRDRPQEPFAPLSRRWLYNVPRSQNTEGVRPLAMLAYLDHAQLCHGVIENIVLELVNQIPKTNNSAEEESEQSVPIRIYLLGSVHGATGSVLSIEFAFLIQQILQDYNIHAKVQLVLSAANQSELIAYELATAAGVACLHEISHHSGSAGLYPGIPSLPQSHHSKSPWENVFLVHGGKLGDSTQWFSAIEQTVDYLCMDACTAMGGILDKCRIPLNSTNTEADCEPTEWLRTFGSQKIDLATKLEPESFVRYLSLQALQPWITRMVSTESPESDTQSRTTNSHIDYFVNDLFRENRWTAQSWVRYFTENLMNSDLPASNANSAASTEDFSALGYQSIVSTSASILESEMNTNIESSDLNRIINQLGLSIDASQKQARSLIIDSSKSLVEALTNRWLKSTDGWLSLSSLFDEIQKRLNKQNISLQTVAQRFRDSKTELLKEFDQSPRPTNDSVSNDIHNRINSLEFQASVHTFAGQLLTRLSAHVQLLANIWSMQSKILLDQLRLWSHTLATDLDICVDANGLIRDDRTALPGGFNGVRNTIQGSIGKHIVEFVNNHFSRSLQMHFTSKGSSSTAVNVLETKFDSPETVNRFVDNDSLHRWIEDAIALLETTSKEAGLELAPNSESHSGETTGSIRWLQTDSLKSQIEDNELPMLADGGAKRSILMIPKGTTDIEDLSRWQATQNPNVTVVEMDGLKSAQLYTEGEQLSLIPIIHRLWLPTHERSQLAERLHSRNDIDWLPLR